MVRWLWSPLLLVLSLYLDSAAPARGQAIGGPGAEAATTLEGVTFSQTVVLIDSVPVPFSMLTFDPARVRLRPLWSDPAHLVGLKTLDQILDEQGAIAGINGGFFNRNTRQPIGAIRREGGWISSPTLGRGAVAWTDQGEFWFGRLGWQGEIRTSSGVAVPLVGVNTALIVAGLAQYTPDWGATYTTQTDGEIVIVVVQDRIQSLYPSGSAGSLTLAIPPQGYLLTGRQEQGLQEGYRLTIGNQIQVQIGATPTTVDAYPHILGAGPLLISDGQIVLDAELERFQPAFQSQQAARSAIGQLTDGRILLLTVGRSEEVSGISLTALAQAMLNLGCRAALNLDGGTSSTLVVENRTVNRPESDIRPRVHNGIGVFSPMP